VAAAVEGAVAVAAETGTVTETRGRLVRAITAVPDRLVWEIGMVTAAPGRFLRKIGTVTMVPGRLVRAIGMGV
jgi:hypothetical protein